MPRKLRNVVKKIEKLFPKKLAEKWDNIGLLIGDVNKEVKNILIALEVTSEVVDEAIENNVDMIITHHPLIFGSIKNIKTDNPIGNMIYRLIKEDISVYSMHTNLDVAFGGTNDLLSDLIGLKDKKVLVPTFSEPYYKIVVYVPKDAKEKVFNAMCEADAGHIGEYSHCTFQSIGVGTFMPKEGANPYIGETNNIEHVDEIKLETIVSQVNLNKALSKMIDAHPYEEVAYDLFKLENKSEKYGLGRVGRIDEINLKDIALKLKDKLNLDNIKVVGNMNKTIKKVALCTGSGASFIDNAHSASCDLYITGDVKYHEAQNAKELGIAVIDAGHFETENIVCDVIGKNLDQLFDNTINIIISKVNINPFKNI